MLLKLAGEAICNKGLDMVCKTTTFHYLKKGFYCNTYNDFPKS